MPGPTAQDYLKLLENYAQTLREPIEPRGTRLELLFEQVNRLLRQPSPFNDTLPAPFRDVARHYAVADPQTVEHFSYDENRQFFLSDLHDFIRLHALRQPGGHRA